MSTLVHIYAVCPLALKTNKLTHLFGPQKGRFIDTFPYTKYKFTKSWADKELPQEDILKLKEIVMKLKNNGSIKQSLSRPSYITDNKISKLLGELNKKNSKITLGIINETSRLCDMSNNIFTLEKFQDENLFNLEPVQLDQSPYAFFDHIPNFLIASAKRFKLVDPYIFEIKPPKSTARTRLEFIWQLVKEYYADDTNENQPMTIEVYGRKPLGYFDLSVIKQHFAGFKELFQTNLPFKINFFIVEEKKSVPQTLKEFKGKGVHERFFCADALNFSFEDSSEDRSKSHKKQTWRYEPLNNLRTFINLYDEHSDFFDVVANFDSDQLEILARQTA